MADASEQQKQPQGVPAGRQLEREDRTTLIKVIVALIIVILFVLFIIRNSARVNVDFVFVSKQIRLVWVFLSCAIIGGIVAWLIGRPRRKAQRRLIEELERYRAQAD